MRISHRCPKRVLASSELIVFRVRILGRDHQLADHRVKRAHCNHAPRRDPGLLQAESAPAVLFHWSEDRVRGHVAVCVYAAVIEALMAADLRAADLRDPDIDDQHLTPVRALRELARIQAVAIEAGEHRVRPGASSILRPESPAGLKVKPCGRGFAARPDPGSPGWRRRIAPLFCANSSCVR